MSIPTKRLDSLDTTINPQRDHEVAAMRDGISNKLRIEQILALLQSSDIPNDAVTLAKLAADARAAIEAAALRGKLLREVFYLFDHIPGDDPPDNSGDAKYIRLTAGQSGAGGYNEGLLTDEVVDGSFPLVEATAEIATGPLAGQRVPLINTEEAVLRARETSGVLQMDAFQSHIHDSGTGGNDDSTVNQYGLDTTAQYNSFRLSSRRRHSGSSANATNPPLTSPPLDNVGPFSSLAVPRIAAETRSKNRSATAYMRIV